MYTTTEGDKIYFNIVRYKVSEPTCNIAYSEVLPLSQSCTDRPHFIRKYHSHEISKVCLCSVDVRDGVTSDINWRMCCIRYTLHSFSLHV
jgi:hypothetical protein